MTRLSPLAVVASLAAARLLAQPLPQVRFQTSLGSFVVEVDTIHAPVTGRNFLRYVDAGYYARGTFHRTVRMDNQPDNLVKIEVIQAAADTGRRAEFFGSIVLERTSVTGLRHRTGTVSMARAGPDTAQDQFFICISDQPELDFGGKRNPDGQGFAAFGRVVSGMTVIHTIHQRPADGQRIREPVLILEAARTP